MSERKEYTELAIKNVDDFIYGTCPNPVTTRSGMVIGGGTVYPELNFTLPAMTVDDSSIQKAYDIYRQIANEALKRASELHAEAVQLEYETTVEFTLNPEWGLNVCKILLEEMHAAEDKYGIKTALRMTVNDNREFVRPPLMRSGENWDKMCYLVAESAKAGADFISIESTGGKELSDESIVRGDIEKFVFALGVLGCRDMAFVWDNFSRIARENGAMPAGDTACGFANTAMVLAEKGFVPRTFAAVTRLGVVPRTLTAMQYGAVGPNKDCGYEGPYIKAITGNPIAMEGRMAAGAHLSQVGNIASCVCDLWSNESIQFIRLLSDMAPTVGVEQLIMDCRVMNSAKTIEDKRFLRDLNAEADCHDDPQGWILRPDVVLKLAGELVKETDPLKQTKLACKLAIDEIGAAMENGNLPQSRQDAKWLKRMDKALAEIPDDPLEFWEKIRGSLDLTKFRAEDYDLPL